ncbi:hypothetical protein KIH39_26450 [Telmatocola sphagniphila]|uniref:Uncharacterized protein n=1 Tax=Telmatocola sphagniphila TaxID=1123043 RepID=A0A8E6B708_9BACT|nr:hypothetical protein [Telmatocola sphagniphila]QVL32331.1 hypothetical protein KIH39_26450 [Telmatocola sphagniphila]
MNFENLAHKKPELASVFRELQAWVDRHPRTNFLEGVRLTKEMPDLAISDLYAALLLSVESGLTHRVFKFRDPHGQLLDDDFETLDKIPETFPDRLHQHYYRREDCDLISGYKLEG